MYKDILSDDTGPCQPSVSAHDMYVQSCQVEILIRREISLYWTVRKAGVSPAHKLHSQIVRNSRRGHARYNIKTTYIRTYSLTRAIFCTSSVAKMYA